MITNPVCKHLRCPTNNKYKNVLANYRMVVRQGENSNCHGRVFRVVVGEGTFMQRRQSISGKTVV